MKIFDNVHSFLMSQEYFISLYDNKIYVYNFTELPLINDQKIIIKINNINLLVSGQGLRVLKLVDGEILISGKYTSIEVTHE